MSEKKEKQMIVVEKSFHICDKCGIRLDDIISYYFPSSKITMTGKKVGMRYTIDIYHEKENEMIQIKEFCSDCTEKIDNFINAR